jgi:tetratricopeptide (TPR) repeat protein/transcriptional regulator with XRE-family HTH domain
LSELVGDLRSRTKQSQQKLADAAAISRDSVARYEGGKTSPPVGYVAFLCRAVLQRSARDEQRVAHELLEQANRAIILYYGEEERFASWAELCAVADAWLEENRTKREEAPAPRGGGSSPAGEGASPAARPVGGPGSAPWQLRAATADFVGREAERERLIGALRGSEVWGAGAVLACIRGLGGAGKTELVYRVAQELAGDFPDGQLLIELAGSRDAPLQPDEALAQVVRAFAPQEQLPTGLPELRARYRSVLHGRRVLIVADDARNVMQLRDLLPPPGSALLITTRWRFALEGLAGANVVELGGLGSDEAAQLLLSLCPRVGPAAEELAARCGFLPLALRIAAGRLASDGTLRVEHYLAQLRDEQRRLSALEDDEAECSVAAVLRLSFNALEPTAQKVLAQLSVFPTSFAREAVAGVVWLHDITMEDAEAIARSLSQLHRAGLIELDAAGERVWLHDLVRAFATAQLDEPEAARQRHAATYAYVARRLGELAQRGGASLMQALSIFDAERPHLEAGLAWALQRGGVASVDELVTDYAIGLAPLGQLRLSPREALLPLNAAAVAAARRLGQPGLEAAALCNLGVVTGQLGDEQRAQQLYGQALALVEDDPQLAPLASMLHRNLALSSVRLGAAGTARQNVEELTKAINTGSDNAAHGHLLALNGLIERQWGDPAQAVARAEEGLALAQASGDLKLEQELLCNVANAVMASPTSMIGERYARAQAYAKQALALAERLDYGVGRARALAVLGNAAMVYGDGRAALPLYLEALAEYERLGRPQAIATMALNLGGAYRELSEPTPAAACFERAIAMFEQLGDRYGLARACWHYGSLILWLQDPDRGDTDLAEVDRAAQLWERSVELQRAGEMPSAQEHAETLARLQRWLLQARRGGF